MHQSVETVLIEDQQDKCVTAEGLRAPTIAGPIQERIKVPGKFLRQWICWLPFSRLRPQTTSSRSRPSTQVVVTIYNLTLSSDQLQFEARSYLYNSALEGGVLLRLNNREARNIAYVHGAKLKADGKLLFQPSTQRYRLAGWDGSGIGDRYLHAGKGHPRRATGTLTRFPEMNHEPSLRAEAPATR